MKALFYFFAVLVFNPFGASDIASTSTNWQTDYKNTLKIAKKENKNVLVYFTGSDWCPPCKMLKKDLFETNEFKTLSEDYVLLYIDIPRNKDLLTPAQLQHNKSLLPKYNKKGVFPLLVALSPNGVILDDYSGYSMNGEVGYHLEFMKRNK